MVSIMNKHMHYHLFLWIRLYCCCVTKKNPLLIQTRHTKKCVTMRTGFLTPNLSSQAHLIMKWDNMIWSKKLIKDKTSINYLTATLGKHVGTYLPHTQYYKVTENNDAESRSVRWHGNKMIKLINIRSLKSWCPWGGRQNTSFISLCWLLGERLLAGIVCEEIIFVMANKR